MGFLWGPLYGSSLWFLSIGSSQWVLSMGLFYMVRPVGPLYGSSLWSSLWVPSTWSSKRVLPVGPLYGSLYSSPLWGPPSGSFLCFSLWFLWGVRYEVLHGGSFRRTFCVMLRSFYVVSMVSLRLSLGGLYDASKPRPPPFKPRPPQRPPLFL